MTHVSVGATTVQVHTAFNASAFRISGMTTNPCAKSARRGMVATIEGKEIKMDFQDGDELRFPCKVSLPKLDEQGQAILLPPQQKEAKNEYGIPVMVDLPREIEMEKVAMTPGLISAHPDESDAGAKNRRCVLSSKADEGVQHAVSSRYDCLHLIEVLCPLCLW